MPEDIELIAYADDIAVVARASVTIRVGKLLEETTEGVMDWLAGISIELALQKFELILPTRKRKHNTLEVRIRGHTVVSRPTVKHLGITIDNKINFKAHAASVAKKSEISINALRAILPNVGGLGQHARRLLAQVPHSVLLYGAPLRSGNMSAGGLKLLSQCQRRIALRVATAYRIISSDALLVLAGIPPIDLMASERAELYEERRAGRIVSKTRVEAKRRVILTWQERWNASEKGAWTRRLIP